MEPLIEHGVCPGECCTYGPWVATSRVPVYPAVRDTSRVEFVLGPGDSVLADSGLVYLERLGIAVVERPLRETVEAEYLPSGEEVPGEGRQLELERGDTIVVLSYIGEGRYRVWHDGRYLMLAAFWPDRRSYPPATDAKLVQEQRETWWVHVTDRAGRSGWLIPTAADGWVVFAGADLCSS